MLVAGEPLVRIPAAIIFLIIISNMNSSNSSMSSSRRRDNIFRIENVVHIDDEDNQCELSLF
jgi:hypothetical protein